MIEVIIGIVWGTICAIGFLGLMVEAFEDIKL